MATQSGFDQFPESIATVRNQRGTPLNPRIIKTIVVRYQDHQIAFPKAFAADSY